MHTHWILHCTPEALVSRHPARGSPGQNRQGQHMRTDSASLAGPQLIRCGCSISQGDSGGSGALLPGRAVAQAVCMTVGAPPAFLFAPSHMLPLLPLLLPMLLPPLLLQDDVAGCFDYYAGLAEQLDERQYSPIDVGMEEFRVAVRREPLGVVALITPWN